MIIIKGLYVHIPFCEKICSYCGFCKRIKKDDKMVWDYLKALKAEYSLLNENYQTIYIGGGTPSALSTEQLYYLLEIFSGQTPFEYTFEINPESYTIEKGEIFKKFKVNRFSIGVQTFDESLLKLLNRQHVNSQVVDVIDHLNSLGLNNISLDLIFSLPGQTIEGVISDLKKAITLKVKHISYYELILEENTLLYHHYKKDLFNPLDEDSRALMYETIIKTLNKAGFKQYEVSNFSQGEKYQSIHNDLYWSIAQYDAIGVGSHGLSGNTRYYHFNNVEKYIAKQEKVYTVCEEYTLYQDYLIFGLRKIKGINLQECYERFKRNPLVDFKELESFIETGFLRVENNYLQATYQGLFVLNKIVEVFI